MHYSCSLCDSKGRFGSTFRKYGFFFRTSDSKPIQRYQCRVCKITCSPATFSPWFRQKKRYLNAKIAELLAFGMSVKNTARHCKINRKTVARKLEAFGFYAESELDRQNRKKNKSRVIEFDDLETFENTKCKPISVTLAVESRTRRILALEVSTMAAKGLLVEKAKKYGYRKDGRAAARGIVFKKLKELVHEDAVIKSDSNPHYPADVKKFFPKARHVTFLSRRSSLGGQGELKKTKFDPIFSLNHTCAMTRYSMARLIRRTWCTTKSIRMLRAHLMLYAFHHNTQLEK